MFFLPVFSFAFYGLYIAAGFSDRIDGTIARKTGTDSAFGAKLDSFADLVFVIVTSLKILPVISFIPIIWIWIGLIAAIKIYTAILAIRKKQEVNVHFVSTIKIVKLYS